MHTRRLYGALVSLAAAVVFSPASMLAQVPGYTLKKLTSTQSGSYATGIAVDSTGNVYYSGADDAAVWKVSTAGKTAAFAGGGSNAGGLVGDNGPATKAYLVGPNGLTFDTAGNLYIAVPGENRVRKVSTDGTITTVAGPGPSNGALGDGGPAIDATLDKALDVAVDAQGNIYIADAGHNRVRIVTPDGNINTFAGTGSASSPLGDGGPAASAGLSSPTALALDSAGNLYISDYGHNLIRKVSGGVITTVAGDGVAGYTGDGGPATLSAINAPQQSGDLDPGSLHITVDNNGNLYICDSGAGRLRMVTPQGVIHTIALAGPSGPFAAGDSGSGAGGAGGTPIGVAVDSTGKLYVSNIEEIDVLTPTGSTFTPLPFITSRVSASAFGQFGQIGQGSWIEIYGSYLAPDTREWAGSDFNGSNAPIMLDGASVSIGGQPAFVDYISPGQINAQVPSNIGTGAQPVIVKTPAGSSATDSITVNPTEPGLLAPSSFKISNVQYVVAQFSDGSYVLPTGAIPGLASHPANPGDTIVIYGIGFGAVTPSIPAGVIAAGNNSLAATFTVKIGGTPATVTYDGLAPGYVGLYQFDVVVPQTTSSGNLPFTFTLGGAGGSQSLALAVQ